MEPRHEHDPDAKWDGTDEPVDDDGTPVEGDYPEVDEPDEVDDDDQEDPR